MVSNDIRHSTGYAGRRTMSAVPDRNTNTTAQTIYVDNLYSTTIKILQKAKEMNKIYCFPSTAEYIRGQATHKTVSW